MTTRRTFLHTAGLAAAAGTALHARRGASIKVGVTDWNLDKSSQLDAVPLAKSLGFEGVQVSLGRKVAGGKLPLDDAGLQGRYLAEARDIAIISTCLDILHVNYLKNDQLGQKWVSDGIRVTAALKTSVLLLPFFGKGALSTTGEMNRVADILRELAPEAEKAKVILGLENTISAQDNLRIIERAGSKAISVYYDVGNSTNNGFDIAREIELLGRKNMCQIHLKDNPHYLGEGKIDFGRILHALNDIDYQGWAVLETDAPSKSVEADMRRNLAYLRRLMKDNQV